MVRSPDEAPAEARHEPCPVRHRARVEGQRIAIYAGPETLTYRDLDRHLNTLDQRLQTLGLGAGDRLAVPVTGCLDDVLLAWACVRLGVIFCPLNPALPLTRRHAVAVALQARTLEWVEDDRKSHDPCEAPTGPITGFAASNTTTDETRSANGYTTSDTTRYSTGHTTENPPSRQPANLTPQYTGDLLRDSTGSPTNKFANEQDSGTLRTDPIRLPRCRLDAPAHQTDEAALPPLYLPLARINNIILTAGSSAAPKAAVHRLGNHFASARGAAVVNMLDRDSVWLLSLPLYHIGGYAILFRVFLAGAALVIDDRHLPLAERLRKHPVTHVSLVPTQVWRLLQEGFDPAPTRLRTLLIGGAPIPQALVERLTDLGLRPLLSYGLTEMASQVCTGTPTSPGAVGHPLPDRELSLRDGEILVRGATLFAGYWQDGSLRDPRDDQGWFATRDLGHLSGKGELTVTGRLDNQFISGGENIQPEAIEARLCDHPAIAQAVVVPVASAEWGQRPVAFVEWHEAPVPVASLEPWLRRDLPGFMVPDAWLPWPADLGGLKVSRRELAERAARSLANFS